MKALDPQKWRGRESNKQIIQIEIPIISDAGKVTIELMISLITKYIVIPGSTNSTNEHLQKILLVTLLMETLRQKIFFVIYARLTILIQL